MKVVLGKDKDQVLHIKSQLKTNGGYCPCASTQTEDTKCPCKAFREQNIPGECHCGLYEKIED